MRPDIKVSNFPVMRIPMGLVEHIVYLFAADILQQVSCPTDCRLWQQIMYFHFEENWVKLHHGPMWCTSSSTQDLDCDAIHTTQQHESENHRDSS